RVPLRSRRGADRLAVLRHGLAPARSRGAPRQMGAPQMGASDGGQHQAAHAQEGGESGARARDPHRQRLGQPARAPAPPRPRRSDDRRRPLEMNRIRAARPELVALFVFVLSRALCRWALGIRFDARPIEYFLQYLDVPLLKNQLLRSLYYLHSQPPGFNLFL